MTSQTINPLNAVDKLKASYLRYLKTAFPIQDKNIREEFWKALDVQGALVKGPLLEATSEFVKGPSIEGMVSQGILNKKFQDLCNRALPYKRSLYIHQAQAIEKSVLHKRNLVVSTGTGSGKTEAFLIPILNELLNEEENDTLLEPGVRALLLYPMNALANDQLKRLRKVLANYPSIKFGRFIGETEHTTNKAIEQFRDQFPGQKILPNELISREQMRKSPPHILLTNYAMLEYLLLRPEDNTFFDGPTARSWKFIVLDEAHIYDGSLGIEIAMLLRRVKDRAVQSELGRLQIFATSATIGTGRKDFPKVVLFGTNLFGEKFEWNEGEENRQDVVEAQRVPLSEDSITWHNDYSNLYSELNAVLVDNESFDELVKKTLGIMPDNAKGIATEAYEQAKDAEANEKINIFLFHLLKGNADVVELRNILSRSPEVLSDVAEQLFPNISAASQRIVDLVNLAVKARPSEEASSLIPARYHVFARALEGAYLCLNSEHPSHKADGMPLISLKPQQICPHCNSQMFEFSNCRQCGEIYLVGNETDQKLLPIETDTDHFYRPHKHFVLKSTNVDFDEDEIIVSGDNSKTDIQKRSLCLACGSLDTKCSCANTATIDIYEIIDRKYGLSRCVSCGKQKQGDLLPVSRMLTGQDAPVSVLASALYQLQPPATDDSQDLPGNGRKLLIFSDSRQNAAFFAPYLEQSYTQFLHRRIIYQELLNNQSYLGGEARLDDLVDLLIARGRKEKWFSQRDSRIAQKKIVAKWVMQEMVSNDRYYSLEAVGLVNFEFIFPENWSPHSRLLNALSLTDEEGGSLYRELFNILRKNATMRFPDEVDPKDSDFAPTNFVYTIRDKEADRKNFIFSWLPKSPYQNRRLDYVQKIISKNCSGLDKKQAYDLAYELLSNIWREITENPKWQEHLYKISDRKTGYAFQIENWCWNIVPTTYANRAVYQCDKCHQVYHENIQGVCPTYKCDGTLEPVEKNGVSWEDNHFRYEYENMQTFPLQAEEHTAQWEHKTATKKQQDFVSGITNVLSCSTTFELGVDVGELQSVLMRNMPPRTANYIQRAGRAGRRTDSAALALTYSQRRSHDLYYYSHPKKMVAGKITPPVISLQNERIIQRHIYSVVFAAFLRFAKEKYNLELNSVQDFFFDNEILQSVPVEMFKDFIEKHPEEIKVSLLRIVPSSLHSILGINDWAWVSKLYNRDDARNIGNYALDRADENVKSDIRDIEFLKEDVIQNINLDRNSTSLPQQLSRLNRTLGTLQTRRLLNVLSTHGVLPKYGFPVDVVELKTKHLHFEGASNIELDRDLQIAISEYAPGSQVVAAKSVWTSGGIVKPYGKEWPQYEYIKCKSCQQLVFSLGQVPELCPYCEADLSTERKKHFIVPEFGFVASREKPKSSRFTRPSRSYNAQVYFADYKMPDSENRLELSYENIPEINPSPLIVRKRYSHYGWMLVINEGNSGLGYRVCKSCGYAEPASYSSKAHKNSHKRPFTGRDCAGNFQTYALAHRYMTDVLEIKFDNLSALSNDMQEDSTLRSALYALLEGAVRALGIRRDDLDGTLYHGSQDRSFIIYDRVPGGAGHSKRISDEFPLVLQQAIEHVSNPCCGPETSCSECLRNYYNQRYHPSLRRGMALEFLQALDKRV